MVCENHCLFYFSRPTPYLSGLTVTTPTVRCSFMLRTILFLLATLVALPFAAYQWDQPLSPEQSHTLALLFRIMLGAALVCFVVSELTGNCSQVDKLWSILPIAYVWVVAQASGWSPRLVLMAVLVTMWALRLTFNFARRGGYSLLPWRGEEDYRWAVLRQNPLLKDRFRWGLFNLFFISLYQNTLILLFTLPTIVAWQSTDQSLQASDLIPTLLFVIFLCIETIADQQQYDFQAEKHRRKSAGEALTGDYLLGFRTSGLWGRVRHPNYAAEQAIWLSFYLFSALATGRWLNWSLAGAILLVLLFLGSSDFSEKISAGKYPGYAEYQRRVPRFLPKIW